MDQELPRIEARRRRSDEAFRADGGALDRTLLDYWAWANSDLLDNTARGILAEYIVALDLGIADGVRQGWDAFDLCTRGGVKVEVKSASFIQSWHQKKPSKIIFGIAPRLAWDPETGELSDKARRHSDIYVFCLLAHRDQETIDPLDTDQWVFYVVPTAVLNERVRHQKTIGLQGAIGLGATELRFGQIRPEIERALGRI